MAKVDIWCEVTCSNCGGVIGTYYRNANTISNLKKKTKDWTHTKDGDNLCPECAKQMKEV